MTPFEKETHEIIEQTIRLTQSYTIFWEIMNPQSAARFDNARRKYLDFFEPVANSLLQGFFIISYQLCDRRPDSKHIRSLIAEVGKRDAGLGRTLKARIDSFAIAKKIGIIRHKIFAHRNKKLTPQQVLATSPILIKELEEALRFIQEIVSTVVEEAGGAKKASVQAKISSCECSARDAAFQVLSALAREMRQGQAPES
jgi:hypothetical protein